MKPLHSISYLSKEELEMSNKVSLTVETILATFSADQYNFKTKVIRYADTVWISRRDSFSASDRYLIEVRLIYIRGSVFENKGYEFQVNFGFMDEVLIYLPPIHRQVEFIQLLYTLAKLPVALIGEAGETHYIGPPR